jgi:putative heme-binding domain-containing protein
MKTRRNTVQLGGRICLANTEIMAAKSSFRFRNGFRAALSIALMLAVRCAVAQASGSDEPAAELASFEMADGFEVKLFASEKDGVVKPIQIRFDARGRLWVIGSSVYPQLQPGQTPNDKVLILEDTNRDGVCDKTTVFADGLMIPTGLEVGGGGAYVGHGTELLFLKDTDGDGKADERQVFMRGFGTGDNHQNINSFLWSPGGELWMSQGLHIHSAVETPWGVVRLDQAGLWRLRPRLQKLEGFYGSQHEPQNPWGFVFTDWGEPIVISGNNSSAIYPVPGLVVNHRDDPPSLIWKNGNARKSSGGDIVGTTHFPDAWQGALIQGGYINNTIWVLKILEDGAGFILEDMPPLIKSSSRSFRPVDAKFGPDGALYICDWYNPIIGHYQASFRHPDRDKTHGRIWRVTAKGRALTEPPKLEGVSATVLLDHLKSPDRWTRRFAKRALAERSTQEITAALKRWTTQPGISEHALVEALGVCRSHEVVAPDLLSRLATASNPYARAYAASTIGAWAARLNNQLSLLRPLATDEHPRVRLHAIVACTYIPSAESMEVAAMAADYPTDKFLDYALNQAVFALKPYWLPVFRVGKLALQNKNSRLGLLIRSDRTPDTLNALRQFLQSSTLGVEQREALFHLLAEVGEESDFARLLDKKNFVNSAGHYDEEQHARILETLALNPNRTVNPGNSAETAVTELWHDKADRSLKIAVLHLATRWKVKALEAAALSAALIEPEDIQLQIAGSSALSSLGGAQSRKHLEQLALVSQPLGQRVAAAVGYASIDLAHAAAIAAEVFATNAPAQYVTNVLPIFLQRRDGPATLANALATQPPSREAARTALTLLNATGRQNQALWHAFESAAGFQVQQTIPRPEQVQALARDVSNSGNARHGAEIFHRPQLGCIACHTVNGQGGSIGPDLSALGTAHPIDFIIGAMLEPQKEIKEGYMAISITTKDGDDYQGYLQRETAEEVVLRDVLQKREVRIRRDKIAEKKQSGSVMPSGLADLLTQAEFRDLLRYLSELGKSDK